jgi:hypothetical protein
VAGRLISLAGALGAAALVSCGASAGAPRSHLQITYWPHGAASVQPKRWRLDCGPARGTHPHPRAACRELARHPGALSPAKRACPIASVRTAAHATVVGTIDGRAINRSFRAGCGDAFRRLPVLLTGG